MDGTLSTAQLTPPYPPHDYSSTSTLAPPSPDADIQFDLPDDGIMADSPTSQPQLSHTNTKRPTSSTTSLGQFAALGQLSYAPATQTTVITTTTTTTTQFPPLILREPKNLSDRDPKKYPLAASPTPAALKDFCFDVDGMPAYFHEEEVVEDSLNEYKQRHNSLQANNGTLRSSTNSDPHFATPNQSDRKRKIAYTYSGSNKRPSSSVSLAEAAEIASLQRQQKKPSHLSSTHSFDNSTPVTPDTDTGITGQFKIPRSKPRAPRQILPSENIPQHRRPTTIDTLSAMDASLPSPSLSPITAAATLHNSHSHFPGFGEALEEESSDENGLDNSQDSFLGRRIGEDGRASTRLAHGDLPTPGELDSQSSTPSLTDIPGMLDSFDAMPEQLQTYVMYQMLRRCAKPTLRIVSTVVEPALKTDFLDLLPLELSMNVISHFDVPTMCRAAQVSKRWRQIVDSDETAWKILLDKEDYYLPKEEIDRAVKEGWGWQFPHDHNSHEQDLSTTYGATSIPAIPPTPLLAPVSDYAAPLTSPLGGRPKRKAAGKHSTHGSNKKRKLKMPTLTKIRTIAPWMKSLEVAQGPIAHANAAAMAVPNPDFGLPSLRNLHLYKSIYRRHHAIRRGWMEEDNQPRHFAFRAHGRHVVTCLQFDTDKIITGSDDTKIHVYDTKTGALRSVLDGHEGGVWALQYDGNTLVSGSTDRSVRVWDIEKGRCLQVFQGHTSTVRCLVILKPTEIGKEADGTPIIMPKEPLIITGSRDSSLRVWKLPQPGDRSIFQTGTTSFDSDNPYFLRALTGHIHSVRAIAAHGDTVVSGSYDHVVRTWKVSTGEVGHRLVGHTAKVYSVVYDHERNRCISGSMDNAVKIWSLVDGSLLHSLDGHTSLVGLLDLSHGRLVSAAADSTLRIWDPENGGCKSTLAAHTGAITCFQHDDQKVISGSDRTVKMWNVKTGEWVRDLLTDLSGVWQVKFNDRRCVAAVQRDSWTYLEILIVIHQVLDFGAARDGIPKEQRGVRTVVDQYGREITEVDSDSEGDANGA
ncbi:WD40 repeat-like protein [Tothia fuscella]|uniref:WD40 repeat-like protein n=1 Tax=Tothia fuscella TaxID=1048955 RepID=A0A9P4NU08_9PEZI|nr:WD40 repeat-like protein [Tothia fuscella]